MSENIQQISTEPGSTRKRKQFRYSATFEFDLSPQATVKGSTTCNFPWTAATRAVKALFKANPNRQPRSLVVVLEYPERAKAEP